MECVGVNVWSGEDVCGVVVNRCGVIECGCWWVYGRCEYTTCTLVYIHMVCGISHIYS